MFFFRVFGLKIGSEINLPELAPDIPGAADATIRLDRLAGPRPADGTSIISLWASDQEAYYAFPGMGALDVRGGEAIGVDPLPGVAPEDLRPFLLGNALGILLFQRGRLVLHGSAVVLRGRVAAFLGHSGQGKSTMAAALASHCPLHTDELLVIDDRASPLRVFPGPGRIKVHESVLPFLPKSGAATIAEAPAGEKFIVPAGAAPSTEPAPLGGLYILEEGEPIAIQPVSPAQAVIELVRHTYTLRPLRAGVNLAGHFRQCARVASQVPLRRLIRPRRLEALPAVMQKILDDL